MNRRLINMIILYIIWYYYEKSGKYSVSIFPENGFIFTESNVKIELHVYYLATPFCSMMLPEWRWLQGGKPRSFRNRRASNIWRPNRCTWDTGKPALRCPYFWLQSSCHRLCSDSEVSQTHLIFMRSSHNTWHKFRRNLCEIMSEIVAYADKWRNKW
jgi:hypothetical protein